MKKLILFTFLAAEILIFSSCLTVGRIQRNCDKFAALCADTKTEIIYRDTIIYLTDTIFFKLPADTIKITDTIRIENNQAILKPVNKQFGLIGVNAWINNNRLSVSAWLRDSTILIPRRDTVIIENAIQQTATTNTIQVKKTPAFYRFTFWFFWLLVAAVGLWFVVRHYGLKFLRLISKSFLK